jgi:membrane protein implicated in regulation of membrane protease activity
MDQAAALFFDHPLWSWLAIAGLLLIGELTTGSGWLLWPAGSAATVGVATLAYPIGWPLEVVLFAVIAIVSTYVGRRFLRPAPKSDPDINDPAPRLLGHEGETVSPFKAGHGRVFVDGKEWSAELDGGGELAARAKVQVVEILGGARLRVRAA